MWSAMTMVCYERALQSAGSVMNVVYYEHGLQGTWSFMNVICNERVCNKCGLL